MNILALGDFVGEDIIPYVRKRLPEIKTKYNIDFTVANGENATAIKGLSRDDAEAILDCGVDLITGGNHIFGKRSLYSMLDSDRRIIRPANYPGRVPGQGSVIADVNSRRIMCMNVSGCVYMEPLACPFDTVDEILNRERGRYDFALLDIHAEATSEKYALARYFDGRIAVMFGTHTHVQTADEQILPGGSAYITDLGMCGPVNGVIGSESDAVIEKMRNHMPALFTPAGPPLMAYGAIFAVDDSTYRPLSVKRIRF